MTDEILIIHSLYSSNRQILVSSYTIRNKANFVSQIIKKDIRNYHWYVIRDKYNLVNTHKLQDPSLLLFSYRAQHKTRKRDGKKFPLRIVELTLRGGEKRRPILYRVYSDREKKRFLEAMAFTPRSVTWVESTSSRSVEKHLGLHFQYMARYMAPNLWPFSKPKYFARPGQSLRVYVCVCVYSATSADAARDSWRIGGRRTLLEFQLIWGTVVPFVCSDQRNGSTRLQNSHSMIRPVFGCDCQSGLLFYRLDFGSSFVLTESRDTRFIYRVYLGYQIFESFP